MFCRILYLYSIQQILRDANLTSPRKQSEQEREGDISEVQLETNMEEDAGDISRSACEGCNEYKQRYIKLNDKYRKGVKGKLKSKVAELEKANEVLAEANEVLAKV